MVLPSVREPSTGNNIALNVLPAANSGKSVDQLVGLGDVNPTFGILSASDFASRVADGGITEDDGLLDYIGDYSRNLASLSGDVLVDSSTLVVSSTLAGSGDVGFNRPNLRDRSALLAPRPFHSPATVKPERVSKSAVFSSLVKLYLVSLGDVGNVICGGKIDSRQNLQTCVASVTPGLSTCGVLSHSKKPKALMRTLCI